MFRRLALLAMTASTLCNAAAAQGAERWSVVCQQTTDGRHCDLSVPLPFRSRNNPGVPVVANWEIINRPMGIDETLDVHIDEKLLPSYRLVGITEQKRRTMMPPRMPNGDIPDAGLHEALTEGRELNVVLIDDATGRQSAAKLPAAGFEAGRAQLLEEIYKGANRK